MRVIEFLAKHVLPTVLPIAAGYLVARFAGGAAQGLRSALRFAFLPALLFTVLKTPTPDEVVLKTLVVGAATVLVGHWLAGAAGRWLKTAVPHNGTVPDIVGFTLPFLALSWDMKALGMRAAALLAVGALLTAFLLDPRKRNAKALFREPWVYGVLAALLVALFGQPLGFLAKSVAPFESAAVYALFLFYLGSLMHPVTRAQLLAKQTWVVVGLRLLAGVAVGLAAVFLFHPPRVVLEAYVVAMLAPPVGVTAALAGKEDVDDRAALVAGTLVSLLGMILLLVLDW
ncbi:MAG: hypothetical protein HY903_12010 [Deltaproteobacteria bacterium]|nr:hypothetical protein [Deltaproteobacteria bacterium]